MSYFCLTNHCQYNPYNSLMNQRHLLTFFQYEKTKSQFFKISQNLIYLNDIFMFHFSSYIVIIILYYNMGNSYKSKKNAYKQPKPIKMIQCPYCKHKFPETPVTAYQIHITECIEAQIAAESPNHQIEEPIHLPPILQIYSVNNNIQEHIYEKVPINPEKTEFKWEKNVIHNLNIAEIMNLNHQTIRQRPFSQKIIWFRNKLEKYRIPWEDGADLLHIEKDNVLMTSIASINKVDMHKQVKIDFVKQKVNDAGGLLRQWMHLATKQIFSASTGIFELANTTQVMYKIKWDKQLDEEFACSLFSLFGTIIGKAVFERIPLNTYLDHTLLRQLTSNELQLRDVNGYDKQLYKNWKYLQQNHIDPFGQYFCLFKQHNDKTIQKIELVTNGQQLQLTEQNKNMFISLSMQYYCKKSVEKYINCIRKAFHQIIPENLISIFDTYELEMILYGLPFVNVDDWMNNTEYKGAYYRNHQIIKWFWKFMHTLDQSQLGKLLHFCTGSTRIPIFGFKKLQSNRGNYAKFLIQSVDYTQKNPFPKAHTCFNRLELPMYKSYQQLKLYFMAIISNNMDGVYGLD